MSLPNRSTADNFNALGKANSANLPPANSTGPGNVDWDNPSLSQAIGDVAALGLTANRILVRFTTAATTGALTLNSWWALWSNATTTTPVLARSSAGVFTITLPTTVNDEIDSYNGIKNNITLNLFMAHAGAEGSTAIGSVNASAGANIITVNTFNTSFAANDVVGTVISVVAY